MVRDKLGHENIRIENNNIKLPKLGWIRFKKSREIVGRILNVTISKSPTNKYFISICTECTVEELSPNNNVIGLDMGLKYFLVDSNSNYVNNPKYYKELENKINYYNKHLSKKVYGSNNYNKLRQKINKLWERITNKRENFLQELSTKIINENQVIVVEGLKIKEMIKDKKFSKSISDACWGKFIQMLKYKSSWYGRKLIVLDTFYPSSQLCSICGYRNTEVKNLTIREWTCPCCGSFHNRDENASINILQEGLLEL